MRSKTCQILLPEIDVGEMDCASDCTHRVPPDTRDRDGETGTKSDPLPYNSFAADFLRQPLHTPHTRHPDLFICSHSVEALLEAHTADADA